MSSSKKSFKTNKTKTQNKQHINQSQILTHHAQAGFSKSALNKSETRASNPDFSFHKVWPDLQLNQSHLFFECTLFLYSVLALFLQYLNLYKTLWWLPNSHWHYSMKYHLINPYLLSCIGLLLGVRVTKCFWDTISERIDFFAKGQNGCQLTCWKVFEYAIVKTPLTTIVTTSFLFSITRIYAEFGPKSIVCFITPFVLYIFCFQRPFIGKLFETIASLRIFQMVSSRLQAMIPGPVSNRSSGNGFISAQKLIDLDSFVHSCSATADQIREEANLLMFDLELRCRYCFYTGFLTSYFAIFMPRAFIPRRTLSGDTQLMLIDDVWIAQLCTIVALTSFSLYVTYLFPINYFDLLYRCVVHLGYWEQVQSSQPATLSFQQQRANAKLQIEQIESYEAYSEMKSYPDGTRLVFNNQLYIARSHPHFRTVCAEPGNKFHMRLYRIAKNPVAIVSYMCFFQAALVAFEFWLLLLTSDWQQIVTLVFLMFANYLLLAKLFKDRIVIGRIYNPSNEDLQLIKQLQEENDKVRKEMERQKLERVPYSKR